jgi:hypothetical protein
MNKVIVINIIKSTFFDKFFCFHFTCVVIGVSTPLQLDEAMKNCIGWDSGTGTFRK